MPGLNQLKKFVSDIKDVGDETKIRAQRGEKPAEVPFPTGISEEDDSEDFVLGVPSPAVEEKTENSENSSDAFETPENENSPDGTVDAPNFDDLFNSIAQSGDGSDLSDFEEEEKTPSEEPVDESPEETPIEDLDFESLLSSSPEEFDTEDDTADAASEKQTENISEDAPKDDFDFDADFSQEGAENSSDGIDDKVPAGENPDDDFSFDGEEINLNEDFSEDIAESEAGNPAAEEDALSESVPSENSFADGSAFDGDFPTDEIDLTPGGEFPFSENAENFDTQKKTAEAETDGASKDGEDAPAEENGVSFEEEFNTDFLDEFPSLDAQNENPSDSAENSAENADGAADFVSEGSTSGAPRAESSSDGGDSADDIFNTDFLNDVPNFDSPAENASENFSVPDFDAPNENAEKTLESVISEETAPQNVDASLDVTGDDGSFSLDALDELTKSGDIDFGESSPLNFDGEFPVTGAQSSQDDFVLDDENFEIPGFSDTETASFTKKQPRVDVADFSRATAARPKNTLTDEEFVQFKKNLLTYPLNLRLAVEDLIIKNEFTDDAVFEVVEKILKKVPARQVASHLEKLLDISIDVPRDYERRSFAEYEAYKQSFQYQLKNRIIPGGILVGIIGFLAFLIFQFSVLYIYKPSMAKMLYKQGYTLLENNAYPQSEAKFEEAVRYKPIKKWFFKYAQGYRTHRQYERASQMYKNILGIFDHDKQAGLEWAEMELYERANYQSAEEIVRRQVLDYHINDSDGLLMLGDVFLEWGEIENEKYEDARKTYSDLIQRYGTKDIYLSRMMRYFVRTDKLKNVLELKDHFFLNPDSLGGEDWVEMSGFILEKLYGPLTQSEEYLRSKIEDVLDMLEIALKKAPELPAAHYNIAKYFLKNNNFSSAKSELSRALDCFDRAETRTKKGVYKEIDTCRLLGELYAGEREYLKAQELYTRGIDLFQTEREKNGFESDENTGRLYADMGDIEYFVSGDNDAALNNYEMSLKNKNDIAEVNYKIGAICYNKQDYDRALKAFIKARETEDSDENLLLALGNVLSLKGDNFAALGYYSELLNLLDTEKGRHMILLPNTRPEDYLLIEQYLKLTNNMGVSLYRIAKQTGDSSKNAQAIVRLSDSIRAWDALTRNPESMVRLGGSNLALQNSKYITASKSDFEPAIYTDIAKTLKDEKILQ